VNAADMHRIRQSLPYFEELDLKLLSLQLILFTLNLTIRFYSHHSSDTEVHRVKAFSVNTTRKIGGSLSMRSYFQIRHKGMNY
jgi:hypothetical protein